MTNTPTSTPETSASLEGLLTSADEFARRDPAKAMASAFGAGLLLHILPIAAIVSALTSVLLMVARPVLLFLGVLKACELCKGRE